MDGSSLTRKIVQQGDDVLLQQGDYVISGLELPLGMELVSPHVYSDVVCAFKDIDDLLMIGG